MPRENRPTTFWTWAGEIYGKAKENAGKAQAIAALLIACLAAYLTWLGFNMDDTVLKTIPVAIFVGLLLLCLFYYAWQAWKKEVESINDLCEPKIEMRPECAAQSGPLHWRVAIKNISAEPVRCKASLISGDPPIPNAPLPLHCHHEQIADGEITSEVELMPGEERQWDILTETRQNIFEKKGNIMNVQPRPIYSFVARGSPLIPITNILSHSEPFRLKIVVKAFVERGVPIERAIEIIRDESGIVTLK